MTVCMSVLLFVCPTVFSFQMSNYGFVPCFLVPLLFRQLCLLLAAKDIFHLLTLRMLYEILLYIICKLVEKNSKKKNKAAEATAIWGFLFYFICYNVCCMNKCYTTYCIKCCLVFLLYLLDFFLKEIYKKNSLSTLAQLIHNAIFLYTNIFLFLLFSSSSSIPKNLVFYLLVVTLMFICFFSVKHVVS